MMAMDQGFVKGLKSYIREKTPFAESMYKAWKGGQILRRIRARYGEDTHVFLMRGATGDTYLQLALIENYIRERHIASYKIIADSARCRELGSLFQEKDLIAMNGYKVESIEKAYMLMGSRKLNLTILFPWTYTLYFNRCRIRMTERFHFMDTYQYYVLNLKEGMRIRRPRFRELPQERLKELGTKGLRKGKTVIIAPEANSVTQLESALWNKIIEGLAQKGYTAIANVEQNEGLSAPDYFCAYAESVPLLEYAGYFIGLRSGFCDIVSSAKCRKVVIYPAKTARTDYSEHRTEIEFCGLKRMHLVEEEDDTLTEIDTPLVRNITDARQELSGEEREYEQMELIRKVLDCFENI